MSLLNASSTALFPTLHISDSPRYDAAHFTVTQPNWFRITSELCAVAKTVAARTPLCINTGSVWSCHSIAASVYVRPPALSCGTALVCVSVRQLVGAASRGLRLLPRVEKGV